MATESITGPSAELETFFYSGIGQTQPLRTGEGWCATRHSTPLLAKMSTTKTTTNEELQWQMHLKYDHQVDY
ncbi:hypothetical protein AB833_18545 [Chromatiales bacterium (ex Bugula neritina AB1)]|nr:hypothetical protein AB833_18545 [Chromatiales bacterium (ex Bugula neritina AB1)]